MKPEDAQHGLGFAALVQITMDRGDAGTISAFEAALSTVPEIQTAERLVGEPDYLLRVVVHDIGHFSELRDQNLATLPACTDSFPPSS